MKLNKFEKAYAKMIYEQTAGNETSASTEMDEVEYIKNAGFVNDRGAWHKEINLDLQDRSPLTLTLEIIRLMDKSGWHLDAYLKDPDDKKKGLCIFMHYCQKPLAECIDEMMATASGFAGDLIQGLNEMTADLADSLAGSSNNIDENTQNEKE